MSPQTDRGRGPLPFWAPGLGIALSLVLLIWACTKPRSSRSADADTATPEARQIPQRPAAPARRAGRVVDPCAEAVKGGTATKLDRNHKPLQAPDKTTPRMWFATARAGFTGRKLTGAELWYLAHPQGGCLEVFVDGKLRGRVSTRTQLGQGKPRPRPTPRGQTKVLRRVARFDVDVNTDRRRRRRTPKSQGRFFEARRLKLSHGVHRVELRPVGKGTVRLFGAVLERDRRGLVLHNLGVPGAQTANAAPGHKLLIRKQIKRLKPDLVIVQLGTNDGYDKSNKPKAFERRLKRLLSHVRPKRPRPDCLLIGPPDFGSKRWRKARQLRKRAAMIRRIQRKVAAAEGCLFWDWYAAMGGAGSMRRLMRSRPKLAYRDRVHFTRRGSRAFGSLLHEELMRGYAAYLKTRPRLKLKPPLPSAEDLRKQKKRRKDWPAGMGPVRFEDPKGKGLKRFYARLALLQRWSKRARARIVYVGDSHIATDQMTGELRGRLQRVFGDAGHGYVHAGKPWAAFNRRQLRHGVRGPWSYYFILTWNKQVQPRDRLYGAGGVSSWITLPLPPPAPRP